MTDLSQATKAVIAAAREYPIRPALDAALYDLDAANRADRSTQGAPVAIVPGQVWRTFGGGWRRIMFVDHLVGKAMLADACGAFWRDLGIIRRWIAETGAECES